MTTYSTLRDVVDQVVRPLVGDYAPDFDLQEVASALTRARLDGTFELHPWADRKNAAFDRERVERTVERADIVVRGRKALSRLAEPWVSNPPVDRPTETVVYVHDARVLLDRLEREAIHELRRRGRSWHDIGVLLGVTRQAAHERFRSVDDQELGV